MGALNVKAGKGCSVSDCGIMPADVARCPDMLFPPAGDGPT